MLLCYCLSCKLFIPTCEAVWSKFYPKTLITNNRITLISRITLCRKPSFVFLCFPAVENHGGCHAYGPAGTPPTRHSRSLITTQPATRLHSLARCYLQPPIRLTFVRVWKKSMLVYLLSVFNVFFSQFAITNLIACNNSFITIWSTLVHHNLHSLQLQY